MTTPPAPPQGQGGVPATGYAPPQGRPLTPHAGTPVGARPASPEASGAYPARPPVPDVEVEPAPARGNAGVTALVALVFFVAGGAAVYAAQTFIPAETSSDAEDTKKAKVQTIHPAGEVLLQASPPEAVVVSESDGQILGTTPMRFLVPTDSNYAVLVTAEGHEPARLVLPGRGRLRTDLVPLDDRKPCRIKVKPPKPEKLAGVAAKVEAGELYAVKGAAVLRSPSGAGAWLVRCPALGGSTTTILPPRPPPAAHRLSVLSPSGATISIDGEAHGQVPLRENVKARFVRVKAETLRSGEAERWVPVFSPTRLKMPKPRKPTPSNESSP